MKRFGFTMIELLVVLLIIAIVALLALPQFRKAAESSRRDQAVSSAQMIGAANQLYFLDHGMYADTSKSKSGPPGTLNNCAEQGPCDCNTGSATYDCGDPCTLIWCGYTPQANISNNYYNLYALDPSLNSCETGKAARMTSGATGTTSSPYSKWGACANNTGQLAQYDSSGNCPLASSGCAAPPASPPPPVPPPTLPPAPPPTPPPVPSPTPTPAPPPTPPACVSTGCPDPSTVACDQPLTDSCGNNCGTGTANGCPDPNSLVCGTYVYYDGCGNACSQWYNPSTGQYYPLCHACCPNGCNNSTGQCN